jgi:hypothetical protein
MFRYKLRTLLIVLALGPPLLAGAWFGANWLRGLPDDYRRYGPSSPHMEDLHPKRPSWFAGAS